MATRNFWVVVVRDTVNNFRFIPKGTIMYRHKSNAIYQSRRHVRENMEPQVLRVSAEDFENFVLAVGVLDNKL